MAPKAIRHSNEDWMSRKREIRELFMEKGLTLSAVVGHLESQGFPVSESQLEYKLKSWGLKKKLPKNSSQAGWQYIHHHYGKRKSQGKETEVVLSGVRLDPQTVLREISRHHSSAWSNAFQNVTSPRTPEGFPISIYTPAAPRMEFKWSNSLPWIQFQQNVTLTVTTTPDRLENVDARASHLVPIRFEDFDSLQSKTSVSAFASKLGSIMPESYEGENFGRAQKLARGPRNEATQEHINIAIFKLSNKLDPELSWEKKLQILETCGIMSVRVQLNQRSGSSRTISALAEALYQDAFRYLYSWRNYELRHSLQTRTAKLITWLLSLGSNSDTYIPFPWDCEATGLQLSIFLEDYELAWALLDAGASPTRCHLFWEGCNLETLPPLSIAICRGNSPGRNGIIRRLLAAGADIKAEQKRELGFSVNVSTLSALAEFAENEADMQEIMGILPIGQAEFVTADVLIAAAWKGNIKRLQLLLRIDPDVNKANSLGLTALHAAAYQGHAKTCKMILEKGYLLDRPEHGAPSPLHLACYGHHIDIVTMLHQHGANLHRGITITRANYAMVSSRYFLERFHEHFSSKKPLKHWVKVAQVAAMLESPIGAAAVASSVQSGSVFRYLVQHGVQEPTRQQFNAKNHGHAGLTPLQAVLVDAQSYEKSTCVQTVSALLDAGSVIVGGEAILALSNLGSWDIVERILSADHDHLAERYDLIPRWQELCVGLRLGSTLLETAILGGSQTLIEHVLARYPSEYSAEALCAACLAAAGGEGSTLALVERLLQNRKNMPATYHEDPVCEATAVGVAAWNGDSAMLEVLHACLPVSHLAHLPMHDTSAKLASEVIETSYGRRSSLSFWHEAGCDEHDVLIGSPVNFALDDPKILDQLFRYGYKLDRISLAIMAASFDTSTMRSLTKDREILPNEDTSRICNPLYHAINKGDSEKLTLLLDLGEDVNDNENRAIAGRSPLAHAVEMEDLSLIEMLLKAGADVNAPPAYHSGRTALQCAAEKGLLGIAKQLIDLGADMNADRAKKKGRTTLEAAAEHGRIDMVQFLLSEGVETTGSGRKQYVAAVARAKSERHYVTVNMLKEHRPWTYEDQVLWESEDLLGGDVKGWATEDKEGTRMESAGEEGTDGPGAHFADEEIENIGDDDVMDWGSSNSVFQNAPLASGPNLLDQDVVAEPGFAIEMDDMDWDAIDWGAF